MTNKYDVGTIHEVSFGQRIKIIEILKSKRKIKFLDEYGYETIVYNTTILRKTVKNPYYKSIYGIGFIGIGKYNTNHNSYHTWYNMLRRAYSYDWKIKNPTYENVTVCEEWLNFQNFAKWYEENYPHHIKGIKFTIDKDLLQQEKDIKIYKIDTCIFLPSKINSFLAINNRNNTSGFVGVYYSRETKKYVAQISDFKTNKTLNLGYRDTKEEASKLYKEYRAKNVEEAKEYLKNLNYLPENIVNLIK